MQGLQRFRRQRNRATGVVIAGFMAAGIFLFTASAGASTIVQLQSPAYLRANGAATEVTVMVVCKARIGGPVGYHSTPNSAKLTVTISQTSGRGIATGSATASARAGDFRCDDGSHYIQLFVLAKSKPFHKGAAFAKATLKVCAPQCHSVSHPQTIQFRR